MNEIRRRHEERRREIIELRRQGLTIREIAEHLGRPQKVIKWHMNKIKNEGIFYDQIRRGDKNYP